MAYELCSQTISKGEMQMNTISHHFGGGCYVKLIQLHDGEEVPQHKHKFDHLTALFSGSVVVFVGEEEGKLYFAPDVIEVPKDTVHTFTAVNGNAVIGCIHATNITDPDLIDETLIL